MAQITLEDTLSDFFAAEDRRTWTQSPGKVYVSYSPIPGLDLTANLPRNTKYLLPQWRTFNGNASSRVTNFNSDSPEDVMDYWKDTNYLFKDDKHSNSLRAYNPTPNGRLRRGNLYYKAAKMA